MSDYKNYITTEDEICDGCGKTLPAGTQCEATEDYLNCMSCVAKMEAQGEMDFDNWKESQDDDTK